MTTDNQELDRILTEYRMNLDPVFGEENMAWKAIANKDKKIDATEYAKAAINQYFLDLIGKDEELYVVGITRTFNDEIYARNELRAELRNKLEANHEG